MKKKDRRFQTLEDIEDKFFKSSGALKEKKRAKKKTAYASGFSMEEFLGEYGRLLVIPAVCILLLIVILVAEAVTGAGDMSERLADTPSAATELSAEAGGEPENAAYAENAAQEESASEEETDPDAPVRTEDSALVSTIDQYFAARLSADVGTLYRLFGRTSDTGRPEMEKRLRAQASWIQSYDGITVYTMPGLDENSKLCLIRYKINFRRTDTNAPGIMYCYVTKQADGSYVIGEHLGSDIVQYINEKLQHPAVVSMQEEVDSELRTMLASDSSLALIYTSFMNGEIYNETAPDLNQEQEVNLFLNAEDSDLTGGLVIEQDTGEETTAETVQETAQTTEQTAEQTAEQTTEQTSPEGETAQ
ncbi:MAG: hypothetical protein Q4C63_02810 [Eubacteriales bacterium]|nr:hypothetical protein [Eubacteriales bacterium]